VLSQEESLWVSLQVNWWRESHQTQIQCLKTRLRDKPLTRDLQIRPFWGLGLGFLDLHSLYCLRNPFTVLKPALG
jgi:hypothetical protein